MYLRSLLVWVRSSIIKHDTITNLMRWQEILEFMPTFGTDWHATNQFLRNKIVDIPMRCGKIAQNIVPNAIGQKWSKRCGHWDLIGIRRSALQWLRWKTTTKKEKNNHWQVAIHAFIISFSSIMSIDGKSCERTPESMAFVIDFADSTPYHVLFAIFSQKKAQTKPRTTEEKTITIYSRHSVSAHSFQFGEQQKNWRFIYWLWVEFIAYTLQSFHHTGITAAPHHCCLMVAIRFKQWHLLGLRCWQKVSSGASKWANISHWLSSRTLASNWCVTQFELRIRWMDLMEDHQQLLTNGAEEMTAFRNQVAATLQNLSSIVIEIRQPTIRIGAKHASCGERKRFHQTVCPFLFTRSRLQTHNTK